MRATTDSAGELEAAFRVHRSLLWGLCYRLTGCAADAEDLVQDTFVRAMEHPPPRTDMPWRPWLVRVATNMGIDSLRRRRRRAYVGAWLPSPVESAAEESAGCDDPAERPEARYELRESVSFAFLLALEALTPRQRAVLLLRDVFDYRARETSEVLGMSESNVRITHHRARRTMREYDRARCVPTRALQEQTRRVLEGLMRCLVDQDTAGMEALLCDSVRAVTDGGDEYTALHAPMVGRSKVMTLHMRVTKRRLPGARIRFATLNGLPALVIEFAAAERRQAPRAVLRCDIRGDGRIVELHTILASRKLTAVRFDS